MKPVLLQKNSTTHTSNFTKQTYPITEELSCHTENTIYSLTCTKGSGTFHKKPGKKAKACPKDGTSELSGEDSPPYLKDGSQKLLSCPREAQYIGKTSQQFRTGMSQHRRSVSPFSGSGKSLHTSGLPLFPSWPQPATHAVCCLRTS